MSPSVPDSTDESGQRYRHERHFARCCALQFLYQADLQADWGRRKRGLALLKAQVRELVDDVPDEPSFSRAWAFAERLIDGVIAARPALDELIGSSATNWTMGRMTAIDRNILRLAAYELCCCDDVPDVAAVDEAVELAKQFGNTDSSRFVNGVLDRLLREHRQQNSPADATDQEKG